MIIALTVIAHDHSLLPYYLAHYRSLGVEKFYLAVVPNAQSTELPENIIKDIESAEDVHADIVTKNGNQVGVWGIAGGVTEWLRKKYSTKDDWIIPADLDELNEYPDDLSLLIPELEKSEYTHVGGELVDRVAADRTLKSVKPITDGISIFDQYPLEIRLTQNIAKSFMSSKVLISRGHLPLYNGHHRLNIMNPNPYPILGKAFHFKWREGLLETLEKRVEALTQENAPWADESVRLLEYFKKTGGQI